MEKSAHQCITQVLLRRTFVFVKKLVTIYRANLFLWFACRNLPARILSYSLKSCDESCPKTFYTIFCDIFTASRRFAHLLAKKDVGCPETKKDLLRKVKSAISSTAERFSGNMQNVRLPYKTNSTEQIQSNSIPKMCVIYFMSVKIFKTWWYEKTVSSYIFHI